MKLGIMQPYFFPYLAYFQLMNAVDQYVVYDDVNYIKRGWINRNNILLGGQAHMINLTLSKVSQNKLINEIEIVHEAKQDKLLKTLAAAYSKAPYYQTVGPLLGEIITNEETNLAKYLFASFERTAEYLGIDTQLILSSELKKDCSLKGEDKVIHICEHLGATEYYNAIGGMELYDRERFAEHHIQLRFLKTDDVSYAQFRNEFVPNLSIIDVMMFNSVEQIQDMLTRYTLL